MDLEIRQVTEEEVKLLSDLETESYPADEADDYDMLVYRHREAPDLTIGGFLYDTLIGFVCATRYHGKQLTDESLKMHIPSGESVCMNSVVVRHNHRRKGIALRLLHEFVDKVKREQRDVRKILLICKSNLIPLYTRAGFVLNGKSEVVHGYPADEAADYDMLVYRHREAPDLTIGGFLYDTLIGFVCATRYHGKQLTDESMKMHIPNGESVCIHSVVVRHNHRRKGIALRLLHAFVDKVKREQRDVRKILLICKSNLIPLYTRAGFVLNGKSEVVHGKDTWYEMSITVGSR